MEITDMKQRILTLLNDGKEILVRWDCGGDERFLYVFIDGERLDYEDKFAIGLERLVINLLDLHSTGEPHIDGEGRLSLENGAIMLEHSSRYYEEDWDDEQEKWIEIDKKPGSGKHILLTL